MSAYRLTEVRCDGCDEAHSDWHVSALSIRRDLADGGWRRIGVEDYCPRCLADKRAVAS